MLYKIIILLLKTIFCLVKQIGLVHGVLYLPSSSSYSTGGGGGDGSGHQGKTTSGPLGRSQGVFLSNRLLEILDHE
jgi:hypothetical protein